MKLINFIPEYREWAEVTKRKSTVRGERQVLARLASRFGQDHLDRIGEVAIQRFIISRRKDGVKNATINRELACLKSVLRLAQVRGETATIPQINHLRESDSEIREPFPTDRINDVLDLLDQDTRLAVLIMFHTGARLGSVCSLTWEQVDLALGVIRFSPANTKQGRAHLNYVNGDLRKGLAAAKGKGRVIRLAPSTISHRFKAAMRKCGIEIAGSCHTLRHALATDLLGKGVDIKTVQNLMGHSSINTTSRYAHSNEARQRAALEGR